MIHIFFISGGFGSTINLVVQNFCTTIGHNPELDIKGLPELGVRFDGSAHTYWKEGHWDTLQKYQDFFAGKTDQDLKVSAPVYDIGEQSQEETIKMFFDNVPDDKVVFVYIPNEYYVDINILARYYKIAVGYYNRGMEFFGWDNFNHFKNWNENYTSFKDMQKWEFREMIITEYEIWTNEWLKSKSFAPSHWLKVGTDEILNNTEDTFLKICNHVDTIDTSKLEEFKQFISDWRNKQQYLVDEVDLVNKIVDAVVNRKITSWNQSQLCIFSEAMIQKKLKTNGYDLRCFGLNDFPTNSVDLYRLVEKI